MIRYRQLALSRLLTMMFLLFVGLAASTLLSPTAEAALAGCRTDPLVVLSDGTVLDVSVAISTNVSNVTDIQYVVHGPSTVRLVSAIRTPTLGFTGKELFTYYADAQPGQYVTETLVQTTFDRIGVTAYTTFSKVTLGYGPPLTLQYKPVSGFNDQVLRTVLRR
jgi:hypothetical protein